MDKFGLSENTINTITEYFKTISEIDTVKIFGSRARGNYKSNSDIDFVISGEKVDLKLYLKISSELEELPTPYKFDVLWDKQITEEALKETIKANSKIFYKKV